VPTRPEVAISALRPRFWPGFRAGERRDARREVRRHRGDPNHDRPRVGELEHEPAVRLEVGRDALDGQSRQGVEVVGLEEERPTSARGEAAPARPGLERLVGLEGLGQGNRADRRRRQRPHPDGPGFLRDRDEPILSGSTADPAGQDPPYTTGMRWRSRSERPADEPSELRIERRSVASAGSPRSRSVPGRT
jgi:hypothetical protein